jgi:hypothetical protein
VNDEVDDEDEEEEEEKEEEEEEKEEKEENDVALSKTAPLGTGLVRIRCATIGTERGW